MTYGSMDQVKQRLNVDPLDAVLWEPKITRALPSADNIINTKLKPYTSVPIVGPDAIIVDCANDYAAAIFRDETSNPTSTGMTASQNPLRLRADKNINDYIRATFGVDPEADIKGGKISGAVHISASTYMTDEMQNEWAE